MAGIRIVQREETCEFERPEKTWLKKKIILKIVIASNLKCNSVLCRYVWRKTCQIATGIWNLNPLEERNLCVWKRPKDTKCVSTYIFFCLITSMFNLVSFWSWAILRLFRDPSNIYFYFSTLMIRKTIDNSP